MEHYTVKKIQSVVNNQPSIVIQKKNVARYNRLRDVNVSRCGWFAVKWAWLVVIFTIPIGRSPDLCG